MRYDDDGEDRSEGRATQRCPKCKRGFQTLADEAGQHACPHCGHGAPDEDAELEQAIEDVEPVDEDDDPAPECDQCEKPSTATLHGARYCEDHWQEHQAGISVDDATSDE